MRLDSLVGVPHYEAELVQLLRGDPKYPKVLKAAKM